MIGSHSVKREPTPTSLSAVISPPIRRASCLLIARRARNAGITLKSDPHDTEWKSRAFEVTDPSGFLLTIFSEASS